MHTSYYSTIHLSNRDTPVSSYINTYGHLVLNIDNLALFINEPGITRNIIASLQNTLKEQEVLHEETETSKGQQEDNFCVPTPTISPDDAGQRKEGCLVV